MTHEAAWSTKRKTDDRYTVITCNRKGYYWGVFWIAEITGTDKTYGLHREFKQWINPYTFRLSAGVYDVYRAPRKNAAEYERYFLQVDGAGQHNIIDSAAALDYARSCDTAQQAGGEPAAIALNMSAEPIPF